MSAIRSRRRCGNWSPGTAPPATSPGPTPRRRPSGDGRHMKVAVVGGGSTYTPELVDGMARRAGRARISEPGPIDPHSALLDAGHRAAGLCNVAIGFQRSFAAMLGVEPGEVSLDHVGLNHLTWERAVLVNGRDRLPELLATHGAQIVDMTAQPAGVLQELGAVPSYYLRYFYCHDAVVAEQRRHTTRAEEVARLERELLALYADPALDRKPELLGERGGAYYSDAAVALLTSLVTDRHDTQVVNVRNAGTMPFLPDEAVIEVPAVIGADGARPVPVAPLDPQLRGLGAHVAPSEGRAGAAAV